MKWTKFKKKPIVIEAIQITKEMLMYGKRESPKASVERQLEWFDDFLIIKTLEGNMRGEIGDWLIKGVKDELYPCKDDIFKLTYFREKKKIKKRRLVSGCDPEGDFTVE